MNSSAAWESLSQNHAFVDGNKRVGVTVTAAFLRVNGCDTITATRWSQERRFRAEGHVPPFQVIDEPTHGILLRFPRIEDVHPRSRRSRQSGHQSQPAGRLSAARAPREPPIGRQLPWSPGANSCQRTPAARLLTTAPTASAACLREASQSPGGFPPSERHSQVERPWIVFLPLQIQLRAGKRRLTENIGKALARFPRVANVTARGPAAGGPSKCSGP